MFFGIIRRILSSTPYGAVRLLFKFRFRVEFCDFRILA
jgi:hypothetical protein